jgi:curved DNA-binding protein CbpA
MNWRKRIRHGERIEMKDYYQILYIEKNASAEDIKKAFRRLALKFHPDRNPMNPEVWEEKFKEINEAYSVLSDNVKKKQYDYLLDLAKTGSDVVFLWQGCRRHKWGRCCRRMRDQTFY